MPATEPEYTPVAGCLTRIFWMIGGFILLFFLSSRIYGQGGYSLLDGLFWLIVFGLVAARYADIRFWKGQTAAGEPATFAHWRRYSAVVLLGGLGLWLALHLLGGPAGA